jgi:TolB-like protein
MNNKTLTKNDHENDNPKRKKNSIAILPFEILSGADVFQSKSVEELFLKNISTVPDFNLISKKKMMHLAEILQYRNLDWADSRKYNEMRTLSNAEWVIDGMLSQGILRLFVFYLEDMSYYTIDIYYINDNNYNIMLNTITERVKNFILDKKEFMIKTNEIAYIGENNNINLGNKFLLEKGPAGGIIFFDCGFFPKGWRFLEVSPKEYEFRAEWGELNTKIQGTSEIIGAGKKNTELIVSDLNKHGLKEKAAQICSKISINGYNDWFIPSRDELFVLHNNLFANGLAELEEDWYWSSTQAEKLDNKVFGQYFGNGKQQKIGKLHTLRVRPIRRF